MHDADVEALLVASADFAAVGDIGQLDDGQGVHVGADEDDGADAILEDADDARAADLLGDIKAGLAQLLGKLRRGLFLLERQFRMCVDLPVERKQRVELGVDLFLDRGNLALACRTLCRGDE